MPEMQLATAVQHAPTLPALMPQVLVEVYPQAAKLLERIREEGLLDSVKITASADPIICRYGAQNPGSGPFWTLARESEIGFDVMSISLAPGDGSAEFNHRHLDSGGRRSFEKQGFIDDLVNSDFKPALDYFERYFARCAPKIEGSIATTTSDLRLIAFHSPYGSIQDFTFAEPIFLNKEGLWMQGSEENGSCILVKVQLTRDDLRSKYSLSREVNASDIVFDPQHDLLFVLPGGSYAVLNRSFEREFNKMLCLENSFGKNLYAGLSVAFASRDTVIFAQALRNVVRHEVQEFDGRIDTYRNEVDQFLERTKNQSADLFPETREEFLKLKFAELFPLPKKSGPTILELAAKSRIIRWPA